MKIGIVFGAQSFEHEISVVSAIALKKILKHEIIYIFCDYQRDFYLIPTDKINSKRFSSGDYKKDKLLQLKRGGFFQKKTFGDSLVECDFIINLVHGRDGEDGKLSSLFDFYGISFIGPRIEGSCISYNKLLTKLYAKEVGVNVLPYQVLYKNHKEPITIKPPFIVKPLCLGSSIGIGIVKDESQIDYALDVAFEFDNAVLIEPFMAGVKEYNLAGCKTDQFLFSIVEEPNKEEFLDFDKKYLDFSRTKRVNEATINTALELSMKESFKKLYDPLFLGALIRCDFFVLDNQVYLNEINPIPGSMANYLFDDFNAVITALSGYLPTCINVPSQYRYINSIQAAKGK
ncbi:MAG: D-alanine--D-alanine ligase [Sulfurospirillaceae bacterium]|nr:D-alanine--D-alanine ligase [Sulfurospirillaceae bacterium]MDD2827365.1 D-alanine--D-alanine ligase [Sulfurospirillaceae bacterium]